MTKFNLNFVLLIILLFFKSNSVVKSAVEKNCSRSVSRKVIYAIKQLSIKENEFEGYMKQECSLNTTYHIYNTQEMSKTVFPTGEVKCGVCNQVLNNENLYDVHMNNKHPVSSDENEFICSEKFCMFFGVCENDKRLEVCSSLLHENDDIINFCKKTIRNCFQSENKDSRIYGLELSHKICDKKRVLILNECSGEYKMNNSNVALRILFNNFSMILLLTIIFSTFYISYKINIHVNKIK